MASNSFQRNPSKIWWMQGLVTDCSPDLKNRMITGSPNSHKSQDSGFSDSDITAPVRAPVHATFQNDQVTTDNLIEEETSRRKIFVVKANNILKDVDADTTPKKNLIEHIKEKYTQKENIMKQLTDARLKITKKPKLFERHNVCCKSLPRIRNTNFGNETVHLVSRPILLNKRNEHDSNIIQQPYLDSNLEECITWTRKIENVQPFTGEYLMSYFQKDLNDNIAKNCDQNNFVNNDFSSNEQDIFRDTSTKDKTNLVLQKSTISSDQVSLKLKHHTTELPYHQDNVDKIEFYSDNCFSDLLKYYNENSFNITTNVPRSNSFSFFNERMTDSEDENGSIILEPFKKLTLLPYTSTPKQNIKSFSNFDGRVKNSIFEALEKNSHILSVQFWLDEIELIYEPECMTTLQSKSISNDLQRQVLHSAELLISPVNDIKTLSNIIYEKFGKMKTQLQTSKQDYLSIHMQTLTEDITDFALKHMTKLQANNFPTIKNVEYNLNECLSIVEKLEHTPSLGQDFNKSYSSWKNAKDLFSKIEYNILLNQIQALINVLDETTSHLMLRSVLSGLTSLALQYKDITDLITEAEGPRNLLILCVECKASSIRAMTLRTLATICSSTSAVRQLEKVGVIEILADILKDSTRPEPELSEATSVLVQITAPWMTDIGRSQLLSKNIETLIAAITNFLEATKCCQNLLLCAAALANFSYMNINIIEFLIKNKTIGKLLSAVRSRGPKASVFLKEQTATLMANLSDIPESKNYLAENNVGIALLCFLQIYPIDIYDEAKSNAAQRLQQKSAVALSRLCSDAYVAQQVVELGGVNRLIQLCKEGKERNYSDTVLVACLAALRKIVANSGVEIMDQYDVMELVQPRLLESFLAYSSQNESYV